MVRAKIMVIEDDFVIRDELQKLLQGNGYHIFAPTTFSAILQDFQDYHPQLVILDIKLPNTNGFSICSEIRNYSTVPIIFVTSCNTDMDELNSIMLGGDAFITKPYHTAILLAKIDSLLKKANPSSNTLHSLEYNQVVLHLQNSTLQHQSHFIELTKTELKIMYYLFKNAGNICSRADMIEYLWDNQLYIDDNTLSVNIGRIREKLSQIGVKNFIKTKHRQGYSL